MRYFQPDLAKYLAQVRGPDSPPIVPRPMPAPTGAAARAVFTEYFLPIQVRPNEPSWYYGQDWMLGPSTGMHGAVGVHDVVIDHAGIAWITQSRTDFETNRTLVKLDPQIGAMSNIKLTDPDGHIVLFEQINESSQGLIWMHSLRLAGPARPGERRLHDVQDAGGDGRDVQLDHHQRERAGVHQCPAWRRGVRPGRGTRHRRTLPRMAPLAAGHPG